MEETLRTSSPPQLDRQLHARLNKHVQAREVVRIVVAALGRNAQVMPLRGVLLASVGVIPPEYRPLHDVDMLVQGVKLGPAVGRLWASGFRLKRVGLEHNSVSLSHAAHPKLFVELHKVPVPGSSLRPPVDYLWSAAELDRDTFGVPVLVPPRTHLAVHLVAHIVNARVIGAYRHAAADVAAVIATCTSAELDKIAGDLKRFSLARGGALAVVWAQAITGELALEDLAQRLVCDPTRRAAVWEEVMSLRRHTKTAGPLRPLRGVPDSLRPLWGERLSRLGSILTFPLRRLWVALFMGLRRRS